MAFRRALSLAARSASASLASPALVMRAVALPRGAPTWPSAVAAGRRSLFIAVETTPNPDSMKFVPEGKIVLPEQFGNGLHFSDIGQAKGSRLVRKLLKIDAVVSVFLGREFVSINKREDANWASLRPVVLDTLMEAFSEAETKNLPLIEAVEPSADTAVTDDDDEVTAMIKELLDSRIRPAVQEDGGDIFYRGFDADTGIVKLKMGGSCVGCPSSTATLRNGVENMLMYYIPEVKGIEEVKDELDALGEKELQSLEDRLKAAGADV